MSRSYKKGPYIDQKLLKKVLAQKESGKKEPIKTWARASQVPPEFVCNTYQINNGKIFIDVFIREEMVGHRLGEFSLTRKFTKHGGKIQRDIDKSAAPTTPAAGPKK